MVVVNQTEHYSGKEDGRRPAGLQTAGLLCLQHPCVQRTDSLSLQALLMSHVVSASGCSEMGWCRCSRQAECMLRQSNLQRCFKELACVPLGAVPVQCKATTHAVGCVCFCNSTLGCRRPSPRMHTANPAALSQLQGLVWFDATVAGDGTGRRRQVASGLADSDHEVDVVCLQRVIVYYTSGPCVRVGWPQVAYHDNHTCSVAVHYLTTTHGSLLTCTYTCSNAFACGSTKGTRTAFHRGAWSTASGGCSSQPPTRHDRIDPTSPVAHAQRPAGMVGRRAASVRENSRSNKHLMAHSVQPPVRSISSITPCPPTRTCIHACACSCEVEVAHCSPIIATLGPTGALTHMQTWTACTAWPYRVRTLITPDDRTTRHGSSPPGGARRLVMCI